MKNLFVAYYRVSTREQGISHLGLDAQRQTVLDYIEKNNGLLMAEFTEVKTGTMNKKSKRPDLAEAFQLVKSNNATLIVARLDRLYRDVYFTAKLAKDGIKFVCCDMPAANEAQIGFMALMAEYEAKLASERTKAALQAKKLNEPTWKPGTNNLTPEARLKSRQAISREARENVDIRKAFHFIAYLKTQGLTYKAIADRLNEENYRTVTGKLFHAVQVRNIWLRLKDE